ncbi:protein MpUGT7 [Marchantia polymorpha subsp. ruderalis]|nr:hypothetical protein MARPO_0055s0001 [Marchantia polymorpha]BBN03074.1 hypothetical protein Mp_2g20480 [Marchantia polymorpha subsp. ruderalis]|eukprot:PTQ37711.1 hypothetical protein MARPO_0055s0001 [Marchantia polymorpha]
MNATPKPRVWIVTVPFFSHTVGATQLAEQIGRHGLAVTLFAPDAYIERLLTSHTRRQIENWKVQGLDIHLKILPIQPAVMAGGVGGPHRFVAPIQQTEDIFEEILKSELEGEFRPTCIVSDLSVPGVRKVATRFNVPSLPLITVSASYTAANLYINQLVSKGILSLPDSISDKRCEEELVSVPGLPLIRMCDLSGVNFKEYPLYDLGRRSLESLLNSDMIIFSGFRELDPRGFRALEKVLQICSDKNRIKMPLVWTIGPTYLNLSRLRRSDVNVAETGDEELHPCIEFLNSQSPASVLYVAFGTDVNHSEKQMRELAYGLESSQQPFLCVLHPPMRSSESDEQQRDIFSILPADCLSRIGSRGLFVSWSPQGDVLSHPSTGGFLSHCGHNSMLESMSMGVPMLAWPCKGDQFANCRFLVDEAHLAIEVCPNLLAGGFVGREDVEKAVKSLFHGEEGTAVRENARRMKLLAEESVGEHGSSNNNFRDFLAHVEAAIDLHLETP